MKMSLKSFLLAAAVAFAVNAQAGWLDGLKSAFSGTNGTAASVEALSQGQVGDGLKEALSKGVTHAIASLGHDGGFLTNLNVKIPVPAKLQSVEKVLRLAGQNQMADDFVNSMNHAAEGAVPVAAGVFGDAIKQMTIDDAKNILTGTNDAATQYFQRTTRTNLFAQFRPLVQQSTDKVGVMVKYKAMMGKFSSVNSLQSLLGSSSPIINLEVADIDTYVTDKALDGLFKMVADEERDIRSNPAARTTAILQKVFGSKN